MTRVASIFLRLYLYGTPFALTAIMLVAGFAADRAPKQVHHYPFVVASTHDGDTITGDAYLGLGVSRRVTVRILDIDAYELRDKPRGPDARAFTIDWLAEAKGLEIITDDDGVDSFGRVLARVYRSDGHSLGKDLLDAGHAVEYRK
jgi:endonuclease YncB( thermonuclease family)